MIMKNYADQAQAANNNAKWQTCDNTSTTYPGHPRQ